MGFTGLARWSNAPATGLEFVRDNILQTHQGAVIGRWQVQLRVYRSSFIAQSGKIAPPERTMCTITLGDHTHVMLEDPASPGWFDVHAPPPPIPPVEQSQEPSDPSSMNVDASQPTDGNGQTPLPQTQTTQTQSTGPIPHFRPPPHYLMNLFTVKPPGAVEHMLAQLRAHWTPIRQGLQTDRSNAQRATGYHIMVEGTTFKIGQDWAVRVGNVSLAGGAQKGLLVEAEYLPMPALPLMENGDSEFMSNFLATILPNVKEARTSVVTIGPGQWDEILRVLPNQTQGVVASTSKNPQKTDNAAAVDEDNDSDGDICEYSDDIQSAPQVGDWTGVDREKRSAFLIWAALRTEGIL